MPRRPGSELEQVFEPDGEIVVRRLAELGIPLETLSESIRIGHAKGDFTTAAHPRTYPGTVVWGELTGELRGRLSRLRWSLDDTDNIARSVSPDGQVVVVAVRGNEMTGVRSKHEQLSTHRPRGRAGVRIVKMNTQYELQLQESAGASEEGLLANLGGTWFLLYNRVGDVVRCELSFANAVTESGKLLRWSERLILPDIDLLVPAPESGDTTDDISPTEVDVPVKRRAS